MDADQQPVGPGGELAGRVTISRCSAWTVSANSSVMFSLSTTAA